MHYQVPRRLTDLIIPYRMPKPKAIADKIILISLKSLAGSAILLRRRPQ
jgi:hypothetical protein